MSVQKPNRVRAKLKTRHDEIVIQDTVAQVHKPTIRDVSSDRETQRTTTEGSETSSCSNKTFIPDEKNEKYSITQTPSVDEDTQISTKIMNLIESEMKRDIKKNNTSHFTDSRPQSLSFYEEEKLPEELSGNLELLSPEERKHYKRRKEHLTMATMMDTDERNIYNISDVYNRDSDDITGLKKSKSRKKKHGESELGDSREMMIPKERKSKPKKKKHHEVSPILTSDSKRKHRKQRDEHHNYHLETRNDVTIALEDLQDDVFESTIVNVGGPSVGVDQDQRYQDINKSRRSPRRADKVYVQRKHKFETMRPFTECPICKGVVRIHGVFEPLNFALTVQSFWKCISMLCHGLLAGLAMGHMLYVSMVQQDVKDREASIYDYSAGFTTAYTWIFYLLCAICIVSIFEKYDLGHLDTQHCLDLVYQKKGSILMVVYVAAIVAHLMNVRMDEYIGRGRDRHPPGDHNTTIVSPNDTLALSSSPFNNLTVSNLTSYNATDHNNLPILKDSDDESMWRTLSMIRGGTVVFAWLILCFVDEESMFTIHMRNMQKYQT